MESSAPNLRPQSRRGGVRVVGKVRPFVDSEIAGGSSRSDVTVSRLEGDHAVVDFGDRISGGNRRDSFKLDWCYEQNQGIEDVFNGEVKPFIRGLFRGCNACVIAYGARGSGKSQLIQGSDEIPGLAFISVSEILSLANEFGASVAMSCYEVSQDHIYDLLEPKEQEVLVLEDAARRIQLKGLSQVPINSMADFKKLYYKENQKMTLQKTPLQKAMNDLVIHNHQGLLICVSCVDKESNKSFVGKMNFVDLTGFEATKQKINSKTHAIECNKINKSLYALLNVVSALNSNESFIPYRESKLTRLLQDCLCRASRAILITCLNPIPCQDTIHAINLASRSSQVNNQCQMDSAKIIKSVSRLIPARSPSTGGFRTSETSLKKFELSKFVSTTKKGNGTPSITKTKTKPLFSSAKKQGVTKVDTIEKITDDSSAMSKGRKLFDGTSPISKNLTTHITSSGIAEVITVDMLGSTNVEYSNSEEENSLCVDPNAQDCFIAKLDDCDMNELSNVQKNGTSFEVNEEIPADKCDMAKDESYSSGSTEDMQSPPISEKLKEISNTLKLLSTQSCIATPKVDMSTTRQIKEVLDPVTPEISFEMRLDGGSHLEYMCTPQDLFKTRSTGLKKSLHQVCLSFFNTASKEELKRLKGIGEKRASFIIDCRENSPEPFKDINDLKRLGLTMKQISTMILEILGEF